jgi:DNA-binding transcriptional MerR regulator
MTKQHYRRFSERELAMRERFRRFIEDEIGEILRSMDEECRLDPQRRSRAAMEWIALHAKAFREEWEREQTLRTGERLPCVGKIS